MRKLRLIKPWCLQAVRQRTVFGGQFTEEVSLRNIPCCGPGAGDQPPLHSSLFPMITSVAAPFTAAMPGASINPRSFSSGYAQSFSR